MRTRTIESPDPGPRGRAKYLLLAGTIVTLLLVSPGARTDDFDAKTATVQMVAVQELLARVDLLSTAAVPGLQDRFVAIIIGDTRTHQTPESSGRLLRECHEQILRNGLRSDVQRIAQNYNLDPNTPRFSTEWLEGRLTGSLESSVDSSIAANIKTYFSSTFKQARLRAVESQRARVSATFYPDISTVTKLDREGWQDSSIGKIVAGTAGEIEGIIHEPLLAELKNQLADLSRAALKDAMDQARAQHEAVAKGEPPAGIVAAENITAFLRSSVEEMIAKRKNGGDPGKVVYAVLPTVDEAIQDSASQLERRRFLEYAKQFDWAVDLEPLRREIETNLNAHKNKNRSLQLEVERYYTDFVDETLVHFVEAVKRAETREACSKRIRMALAADPDLNLAARGVVGEKLQRPVFQVRSQIADAQLRDFAALYDDSWRVPEPLILELVSWPASAQHGRRHGSLAECLHAAGFEKPDKSGIRPLLEESEEGLIDRCQQLMAEARYAFDGQSRVVMRQEETVKREIQSSPTRHTFEAWVKYFTGAVQEEWSREVSVQGRKGAEEASGSGKYIILFDAVRKRIREVVKSQFEVEQEVRRPDPRPEPVRSAVPEVPAARTGEMSEPGKRGEGSARGDTANGLPKPPAEGEQTAVQDGRRARQGGGIAGGAGERPDVRGGTGGSASGTAGAIPRGIPWWVLLLLLLLLLLAFAAGRFSASPLGSSGPGCDIDGQPAQIPAWGIAISRPVKDLQRPLAFYMSFEGARLVNETERESTVEIGSFYVRLVHAPDASSSPPLELSVLVPNVEEALKRLGGAGSTGAPKELYDPDGLYIGVRTRSDIMGGVQRRLPTPDE